MDTWTETIADAAKQELNKLGTVDGAHDFSHLCRVSALARRFALEEGADELVVYTAGMLHDIVCLPKDHPNTKKSSQLAADRTREILLALKFPQALIANVCHSVHAHSFSAKVEPQTIEAKCLQDADRMESLGVLGLVRTFYCSGTFNSRLFDEHDPSGANRELDDKKFALDHFPLKLLTLYRTMQTEAGKETARSRSDFLEDYRNSLIGDVREGNVSSSRLQIARVYHEAGLKKLALFHPEDPFASSGRDLGLGKYALDHLLTVDDPYVHTFLAQLRLELMGV